MRTYLSLLLAVGFAATHAQAELKTRFKTMHVNDLAPLVESHGATIYDVNVESTRQHVGIIPGAKLLSSSSKYDVAQELPADKSGKLVFYCANTQCTASHTAAERAIDAGYKDVNVMVDGVYGWKNAGKPLAKVSARQQPGQVPAPVRMEPKEVQALVKKNDAVIVDVREGEERHEVIGNSRWMPMSKANDPQAWKDFEKSLPKDKTIVFHCAAGVRAKRAADKLAADGYKTGFFEGPDQWRSAGLPLSPGPAN